MKYRVTEKHPAYKEGLEITNGTLILPNNEDWGGIFPETITDWINLGWIEEIQDPQFTEKDIKAFGNYCLYNHLCYGANNASEAFNNWIRKYKDEKQTD